MNKMVLSFILALSVGLPLSAQVAVNIDFDYATDRSGTYSGQGVYSDSGNNYWNSFHFQNVANPAVLKASDGTTSTGLTFSLEGYYDDVDFSDGGTRFGGLLATDLMKDYIYTYNGSGTPVNFTIGGLTVGASYDIYIYSAVGGYNGRDRQATFTLDGVSQNVNGYASATVGGPLYDSFVQGDNYLLFTVTPASSIVSGSFYTPSSEAEFNGLQIVQTSAVPEPSTYAVFAGLLALTLAMISRKRSRSNSA